MRTEAVGRELLSCSFMGLVCLVIKIRPQIYTKLDYGTS